MALGFSTTLRTSIATAILNAIDAGAGAATIKVYDGTRPATGGTVTNLLATFTLADPAGSAASGVLTFDFDPDISTTWSGSGTATWFRIETSDPTFVVDGSVGLGGSGADLELSSVNADGASTVTITDGTFTVGNA